MMSTSSLLETLIVTGMLQCPGAQPATTVGLFMKLLEVAPKMKASVASACLSVLPSVATKAVSQLRVTEYFELLQRVTSASSPEVAVCSPLITWLAFSHLFSQHVCLNQLEALGKSLHERAKQSSYEFLRSNLRLHAWVLEDGLFNFPSAVLGPDEGKVCIAFFFLSGLTHVFRLAPRLVCVRQSPCRLWKKDLRQMDCLSSPLDLILCSNSSIKLNSEPIRFVGHSSFHLDLWESPFCLIRWSSTCF
jgi:hypothetical protein